jgi:RNA-dependent RNA polymerase
LIFCPARYAARLSQAFTATDAVKVDVEEVIHIDDICTSDGKYQFTDGVGTLSKELSRNIWAQLKKTKRRLLPKEVPPAYQIRFMGSKGMISVDHTLGGSVICLRPSMVKFLTPETVQDIEIARAFDKPGPYFLNRPLIMLLEGLGVPFSIFKRYQDEAVQTTRKAASSLKEAASLLECHGLGASYRLPWILNHLDKLSLNSIPDDEFYKKMLEYATHHVLRDLKNHSRIPVPGAWTLVGVADTHRYLKENQIFTCIKPISGGRRYLSGRVLISRSPTIHPGDVRIVEAIGAPPPGSCFEEEPLANTVVFSVQGIYLLSLFICFPDPLLTGERPLPSCLGGGDLDGDLYNLIPLDDPEHLELRDFLPRKPISSPASYEPAPKKMLNRPSNMQDVADFVMEYISSDVREHPFLSVSYQLIDSSKVVGIVAMNWLIIADLSRDGIFDDDCITLANLHSNAVDYPKSGQPVPLEKIPKVKTRRRPDWNAPETIDLDSSSRFYESRRAIGRLFRAIDLPVQQEPVTLPRRRRRQGRLRDIEKLEAEFDNFDPNDATQSYLFEAIQCRVEELIQVDTDPDEELVDSIARLFKSYAVHLQTVCMSNTVSHAQTTQLSEAEVIMGTIAQQTTQPRKRKELMAKVRESTDRLVRGIREELAGDDSIGGEESLHRAWTAWEFSVSQDDTFGAKSFGWIALGLIFDAIKEVEDEWKNRQA